MQKKFLAALAIPLFAFVMLTVGCVEKKGPMEKAGENIDDAVEEVGDKIEDATDGN